MRIKRSEQLAAALAMAAVLVLAACSDSGGDGGGPGDNAGTTTIHVGAICDLSGALAAFGDACKDGMTLGVETANANGGFTVAGEKYVFDADIVDGRSDPTAAVAATQGLLNDKGIKFLFGPDASATALQVAALTKGSDVLHIIGGSAPAQILGTSGYDLMFGTVLSPATWTSTALPMLEGFGVKSGARIAVIYTDDATGKAVLPSLQANLKTGGYQVDTYTVDASTTDYHPLLTRVRGTNPACIIAGYQPATELPMARAILDLNATKCLIDVTAQPSDVPLKIAEETGKPFPIPWGGLIAGASVDAATTPGMQAYKKLYMSKAGKDPSAAEASYTLWFYDFPKMLSLAMQKAGTVSDTHAIAQALAGMTYTGALKDVHFTSKHSPMYSIDNVTVVDGKTKWTAVTPQAS